VQDRQVGNQLIVFHDLALLVAYVFRDDALVAEEEPFDELVELFTFIGRGLISERCHVE
jgi:hypothetical protein